jgi:hypothetical protein
LGVFGGGVTRLTKKLQSTLREEETVAVPGKADFFFFYVSKLKSWIFTNLSFYATQMPSNAAVLYLVEATEA